MPPLEGLTSPRRDESAPARRDESAPARRDESAPARRDESAPARSRAARTRSSSRRGRGGRGTLLALATGAMAVAVVLLVLNHSALTNNASSPRSGDASSVSSNTPPRPSAKIGLVSPTGAAGRGGIAEILRRGRTAAVAIVAHGIPANTRHNAYAIWLYNSPSDAVRLGFVNPGVGRAGYLDAAGRLPAGAGRYHRLLVTIETVANPSSPGPVVLEGMLGGA